VLSITEAAALAIKNITASIPDVQGVRLEAEAPLSPNGSTPHYVIAVSAASEPAERDQVIDEHGAHVYVEAPLADYLHDKVLDVRIDEDGAAFMLSERA